MLLATRLIDPPAIDRRKGCFPPQRATSLGEMPQRQKNPWISWLGNRSLCANESAAFVTLPRNRAVNDIAFRMPTRKFNLPRYLFWQEHIICIKILHPLPKRQLEQPVTGCTTA